MCGQKNPISLFVRPETISFLSPKRKFTWSNDIMIDTSFYKKLKFNRSHVNSKSGDTDVFYWGLSVFVLPYYLLGEYDFMSIHCCYRLEEGTKYVDQLINCEKLIWIIASAFYLTNKNTLEKCFHSTKDPGRS